MAHSIVRYGVMRFLGVFSASGGNQYRRDDAVIVRTDRGLEVGEVLCDADDDVLKRLADPVEGQILRCMTPDDRHEVVRIKEDANREMKTCRQWVEKLDLAMQLVDIEHIFGGERIVVYYLAESRVDFRELVKKLAGEFQTRIEMRQIGVRDEAKLLADFGDCGNAVCCNNHLVEMPPVSMKMAKLQKATLDPTKISGRCGRLKCCLRYEYETYEGIRKELPPVGAAVETAEGPARVIGHELLTEQLLVVTEDHRRLLVDAAETSPISATTPEKKNDEGSGKEEGNKKSREVREEQRGS